MSLDNVPDAIRWIAIFGPIALIMIGQFWALKRTEDVLDHITWLITDSQHYCGTCLSWGELNLEEDHRPPWQLGSRLGEIPAGTAWITDHEYHPLYLVDLTTLTRDPESWERYGRHLKLDTPS